MFLFGKDPTGKDMASPQNPVLDFSGSLPTGGESFYPGGLMHSHLRDVPILSNWLAAQAMPASSCSTIKKQLCCSGSRCGISENDLQEELSTPLATPVISR